VAKAWKLSLEDTRCQSRTSTLFFKLRVVRTGSSGVGALPSSIHRHGVCVTAKLRITRSYVPSRSSFRGLDEQISARLAVRSYAHEAGNISAAMEMDSGQRSSPEGIETPDGSLFLRAARITLNFLRQFRADGRTGGLGDWDDFPFYNSQQRFLFLRYAWC
jgi:hypothetical protein